MTTLEERIARLRELAAGHTEGPWEVKPEECDKPYIRIRGTQLGRRYKIANVITPVYEGVHEREARETRANAHLIAATPDMMAVINELEAQKAELERKVAVAREALSAYLTGPSEQSAVMKAWDGAREALIDHPEASLGRDIFETALDEIEGNAREALSLISTPSDAEGV